MGKIIDVKNITTSFKDLDKKVHNELNFSILEKEIIAIIGANGCGKTTLVNRILNMKNKDMITDGEIEISENINPLKDIGIQFQVEDKQSDLLKVSNLIKFYKFFYKDKIVETDVTEMIGVFGVDELLKKKLTKLSGGQKQRLNLLLACMHKPKILILDELTTGLDITSSISIIKYIKNLATQNGMTVIIVTHNPKVIKTLATRVIHLRDGEIKSDLKVNEISKKCNDDFDEFLINELNGGENVG